MLNLRNINPYVESTFSGWTKSHSLAASAPRTAAPLQLLGPTQLAGTSSFGMSGVNAHALFEAEPLGGGAAHREHGAALAGLRRERHWGLAPVYYLAHRALPGRERCSMLCNLARPELAFLWDHQASGQAGAAATAHVGG